MHRCPAFPRFYYFLTGFGDDGAGTFLRNEISLVYSIVKKEITMVLIDE